MSTEQSVLTLPEPDALWGVKSAIQKGNIGLYDQIADTYKDLWDVATMRDADIKERSTACTETELGIDEQRRREVLRGLVILAFYAADINARLMAEWLPDGYQGDEVLLTLYSRSIDEISVMHDINPEEVEKKASSWHKAGRSPLESD